MPVLFTLLVAGNSSENISRVGFINNFGSNNMCDFKTSFVIVTSSVGRQSFRY